MRCFISAAAALVKVTMSSSSGLTGAVSSARRETTRLVRTEVLPEPAAALTSRVPPRSSTAACCHLVKRGFSAITHSPFVLW